jgi:AraC family ethanolamine operon transcriptional activator
MAVYLEGWNIDLMQLQAGPFSGEHVVAGRGPVLLQGGRTGPVLLQRGTSPPHPTFCIRADNGTGLTVNGRKTTAEDVSILHPGQGFTIHSDTEFPICSITVEESHLRGIAREIGLERSVATALRHHRVRPADETMNALRAEWLRLAQGNAQQIWAAQSWHEELETGLVRTLVRALATASGPDGVSAVRALDRVVRGVEAALDQRPRHAYSVRGLAAAVGVSERTLRRAVQAWYRVPTNTVVRTRRLHGARRELLRANAARESVTSIAIAWGFDHLGRFAGDYRALFAELPSETLQRGSRVLPRGA